MAPLVYEKDWERYDGFTPTFNHPALTADELSFLLGAAYARFYMRPSCLTNIWRVNNAQVCNLARRLDVRVLASHTRKEIEIMSRAVA
jgi:hypothetical protein